MGVSRDGPLTQRSGNMIEYSGKLLDIRREKKKEEVFDIYAYCLIIFILYKNLFKVKIKVDYSYEKPPPHVLCSSGGVR